MYSFRNFYKFKIIKNSAKYHEILKIFFTRNPIESVRLLAVQNECNSGRSAERTARLYERKNRLDTKRATRHEHLSEIS